MFSADKNKAFKFSYSADFLFKNGSRDARLEIANQDDR